MLSGLMTPDFCWDIWVADSKFGIKMKALIHCINGGGLKVCVFFLACFGPLSTNWGLFKHYSLAEYYWPWPWCTCRQVAASSRMMHHVTNHILSHFINGLKGLNSQILISQSTFVVERMLSWQIWGNYVMLPCKYDHNMWGMISAPC